jgi:hypothetical protein
MRTCETTPASTATQKYVLQLHIFEHKIFDLSVRAIV